MVIFWHFRARRNYEVIEYGSRFQVNLLGTQEIFLAIKFHRKAHPIVFATVRKNMVPEGSKSEGNVKFKGFQTQSTLLDLRLW